MSASTVRATSEAVSPSLAREVEGFKMSAANCPSQRWIQSRSARMRLILFLPRFLLLSRLPLQCVDGNARRREREDRVGEQRLVSTPPPFSALQSPLCTLPTYRLSPCH